MTTSVYPATGGFVDNTSADVFIPEIWSDEVIAAHKTQLVVGANVRTMNFRGKKGDTIHVPIPIRGTVTAKAENTAVTVQMNVDLDLSILIDQHFEYSRLIEDITEKQAMSSLRRFFTDDAGFALATEVDNRLFLMIQRFGDGTASGSDYTNSAIFYPDTSTSVAAYAVNTVASGDDITDAVIRLMIQKMDDNDVPMSNRNWAVPPISKRQMLGIERFSSSDFVGNTNAVKNGFIGELYGVDFMVSTNVPVIETAGNNTAGDDVRSTMFWHKDAIILVEQVGIRSQTQYKQEWLSFLYTSDRLYGTAAYRPEAGFALAVHGT